MLTTDLKQERIHLRLPKSAKKKLERAASYEGKTISSFVLGSALANAEKTIQTHDIITLNERDSELLLEALSKPIKFNDALTSAMKAHEKTVSSE